MRDERYGEERREGRPATEEAEADESCRRVLSPAFYKNMSQERENFSVENEKAKSEEQSPLGEKAESLYGRMFEIKVFGEENLQEIPEGKKVIFAPTHMTDMDMGCALAAIGRFRRNLVLGVESSPDVVIFRTVQSLLAGKENFQEIPVAGKGRNRVGKFEEWIGSEACRNLQEDLKEEKNDVLISSYFDPRHAGDTLQLSEKLGVGAVYLAQMAEAIIVPVAVDTYAGQKVERGDANMMAYLEGRIKNKGQKPKAIVHLGEPISFPKIEGIGRMGEIIRGGNLEEFRRLSMALKAQSAEVMRVIALMLPEEKRGSWK